MPRLIDADALKEKKVYSHERHEKIVPVAEIDWAPTVDAIPVEWLKWRTMNAKYNGIKEAADAFDFVLNCWKEQEAQNDKT